MGTPRYNCIAVVLPDNQLMVVEGYTSGDVGFNSVEFASIFIIPKQMMHEDYFSRLHLIYNDMNP